MSRRSCVPRGAHRRGVPLWVHLTSLVLTPLLGVGVLIAVIGSAGRDDVSDAAGTARAVATVTLFDHVRSAVEAEVVPTLGVLVMDDPAAAAALGLPGRELAEQRRSQGEQRTRARAAVDAALARAAGTGTEGTAVARSRSALTSLRDRADAHLLDLEDLYLGYLAISDQLMNAEKSAAAIAASGGAPAVTGRAVQDVLTVAQLAQVSSRQLPLYLGAVYAGGTAPIGSRLAWRTGWMAYTDAQDQLGHVSQPALRADWAALRSSALVAHLDAVLRPPDDDAAPLQLAMPDLLVLLPQSAQRDTSLTALVDTAAARARELAGAAQQEASTRLHRTLLLGLLLLLASVLGAALLGRRISRSLGLLAGQAQRVSRGDLVPVAVRGPREVQTVSGALGSAVDNLRRVQDQAHAVARGDLDGALREQPLPGPLGEVVHASVQRIVRTMRQREELQSALAHQAAHDLLTELPNRAQALTLTAAALSRAGRVGAMTGLLFVDLDGFKTVNDRYGHACGDGVLRTVARRLSQAVRAGDVVCRLGGDEFVVLVEAVAVERDLVELAERVITVVGQPIVAEGQEVRVGASVGAAVCRDGGTDADVLLAEADAAAHRAKRRGRGRVEVFDDALRAQLSARAELETAIAAGLADGQMRLHYQPVVDLSSGALTGFEALVRWERPGHGLVPPDQWVPVAEESRLVIDLDRWVLREATAQLARWRAAGTDGPDVTVAVNVSGRHLTDRRVVQDVADALAASGLPARLLVVEVTETVLVDDPVATEHLAALRAMGVSVAIDDFGTGYTSIGQLRNMPVDVLKIDRSFVASDEAGQRELVALMVRAAHTFGLTVVAEGVEHPDQLTRVRDARCDHAQGYLFHRPLQPAAAEAVLRRAPLPA